MKIKITTLIENNPDDIRILFSEHGLSLYIQIDEIKILFDTGQSGNFIKNAEKLNINLNNLEYVVLSHGHYDHSGGFTKLVDKIGTSFKLIINQQFFNNKYKLLKDDTYKYNGNNFDEKFLNQNNIPIKYIKEDISYINENIIVFSNFKRSNDFELSNRKFKIRKNNNYIVDNFLDEIVLAVKLNKGLLVILGCSHVGIVNILETIIQKTHIPIYGIIGGTHLIEADELRLKETIKYFKEKDIKLIGVSHCTGEKAIERLKYEFKDRFLYNNTGNEIEIN